MLRLGGLLALIALAAAAFWLAISYDREQPSVPEQATRPPAEQESTEPRPGRAQPSPAAPQITRSPAEAPSSAPAAPAAAPVQDAVAADGQALPPLVLPPPEPPPTRLW